MKRPKSIIPKQKMDKPISKGDLFEEEMKTNFEEYEKIKKEIEKKEERLKYLYETGAVSDQSISEKIEAFFNEKKIKEKFERLFEHVNTLEKHEVLEKLGGDQEYDILIYGDEDRITFSLYDYVFRFLVLIEDDPAIKFKFRKNIDNFQGDVVYYEEENPFFGGAIIRKGTKQEFIDRMNKIMQSIKEREELFEQFQKESEKLRSMGYTISGDSVDKCHWDYKDRFLKVLTKNKIENIKQIPEKLSEQKNNSALQLFSNVTGLTKVEYKDDIYAHEILKLIDEFNERIEYEYLNERDFEKIVKIFILGHVDDPLLFYKFEKLKQQNNKNRYKRLYRYGKISADDKGRKIKGKWICKVDKESLVETKYIDGYDLAEISNFLKRGGNISDLEEDKNRFLDKVEISYKYGLKLSLSLTDSIYYLYDFDSLLPCENEFEKLSDEDKILLKESIENIKSIRLDRYFIRLDKYFDEMLDNERNPIVLHFLRNNKSINKKELKDDVLKHEKDKIKYQHLIGCNSHNMQNGLGIDRQTLAMRMNETKKEFIDEFPDLIEKITFRGLVTGTFDKEIYLSNNLFLKLENLREKIKKAFDYYNLDLSSLKEKIIDHIKSCMQEGINFIKNKEKCEHKTRPWSSMHKEISIQKKRQTITYHDQIKEIVKIVDILNNNLKILEYSDDITKDREMNKEKYIQEYFDGRKQIFIDKKIKEVLTMEGFDINQKDEMRKKMIINAKQRFMAESLKYISKKIVYDGNEIPNYAPMKNYIIIKIVNDVLFVLGYWTLLKQIMPDDKERRIERKNIVRTIAENCLKEIGPRLANPKTFDDKEYYLLDPLLYLLKKYGGNVGDFKIKHKKIKQNYFEFVKKVMDDKVQIYFDKINKFLSNQHEDKKSVESVYNYVSRINVFVFQYISLFIKKNEIKLKGYEVENVTKTLDTYIKKNSEYLGDYSQDHINMFSLWHYSIIEIEKILPLEINHSIKDIFHRLSSIKPQIWKGILAYWFKENTLPGGKLNRVVNEVLFERFGLIDVANQEQIDYVILYIENNLIEIVLQDIKSFIFNGCEYFESEKELIRGFLNDFISNWKKSLLQKKKLGRDNKFIK